MHSNAHNGMHPGTMTRGAKIAEARASSVAKSNRCHTSHVAAVEPACIRSAARASTMSFGDLFLHFVKRYLSTSTLPSRTSMCRRESSPCAIWLQQFHVSQKKKEGGKADRLRSARSHLAVSKLRVFLKGLSE